MDFTVYELEQIYDLLKLKIEDDHRRIAEEDCTQDFRRDLRANIKLCTRALGKIRPVLQEIDEDFSDDLSGMFLLFDPADR